MPNKNNNRITIKQLYDEVIPLLTDIATQKVKIENIQSEVKEIKYDMKCKMSIKAFGAWIGTLSAIIAIVITIISLIFLRG
jgi:hypothetical protein